MTHLDTIINRVDGAIEENVIIHMNELLVELSEDSELGREERYVQQQRLRHAIALKGNHNPEDAEIRHDRLTKGGSII